MMMKNILKLMTLGIMILLSGCNDDAPSKQSVKTKLLTSAPWAHAQVTHTTDGDLSNQYTNFAIAFTRNAANGFDGTFLVSNGGFAFSETSGNWKFSDDLAQIILDSGKTIDIQLDKEHLQLDFIVPPVGGKITGVSGHFIFDLQPL